jgi:hypothetical protein
LAAVIYPWQFPGGDCRDDERRFENRLGCTGTREQD